MTHFIGIDPSTKAGFVKLVSGSNKPVFQKEFTSKLKADPERFIDLANQITSHIRPNDIVCIEGFSYGSQGKGVSTQYGIGWLIRAELVRNGYTYFEVPPSTVKKFATGKGNTKKDEMVLPIFKKWGFESHSDNIRDAFVLAKIAQALNGEIELTEYQKEALKKVKS